MTLPERVIASRLWARVSNHSAYEQTLGAMRELAQALGRQVERSVPDYTDHSVTHMDALWSVADEVLSEAETAQMTPQEAFVLGASFYVHDLGMAFAATEPGANEIRRNEVYRAEATQLRRNPGIAPERVDLLALRSATRELHASKATDLVLKPLPGIDRYLIENTETRSSWGHMIGQVAASHHWDLNEVHRRLGVRNSVPTADRGSVDLGYVACILRICDYAHINRERASDLERGLRSEIGMDSLVHWNAQARITGPTREADELVYGCTTPIEDVDAWWQFFDMAAKLDAEVASVREYLRGRAASAARFCLRGVKGTELPQTFANYVQMAGGTAPIDIRVQPHSMERVVEMLGGKHIYGADQLAPIRELIQNARDAILLRQANQRANNQEERQGQIVISLEDVDGATMLTVHDNGVGMLRSVVTRHLIGVGSDFWHSAEFYRDFGKALDAGFHPIGKFGVGFLSVFMLGDRVEVETEAAGGTHVILRLRGIGRRGELSETPAVGEIGTKVRIVLRPEMVPLLSNLEAVVRARAPMLPIPILVRSKGAASSVRMETITPGWWKHVELDALIDFVRTWRWIAFLGALPSKKIRSELERYSSYSALGRAGKFDLFGWPGSSPQLRDDFNRVVSSGGTGEFGVLRCSEGIAVDVVPAYDMSGISEVGELDLPVSRNEPLEPRWPYARPRKMDPDDPIVAQADALRNRLVAGIYPDVIAKLNELERYGMLPARMEFLRGIARIYGNTVLIESGLRWIPVVQPPGNLVHHSAAELAEQLRQHRRVGVFSGIGPGGAYAVAARYLRATELGHMLVIAFRLEEVQADYSDKDRLKIAGKSNPLDGPLEKVLGEFKEGPVELTFLSSTIEILAGAWSIPKKSITDQQWRFDFESNILWADLRATPVGEQMTP